MSVFEREPIDLLLTDLRLDLHETEQKLILQALATANGNVTAAAKKLGISRRTLHRKINEMNVAKFQVESTSISETNGSGAKRGG